VAGYGESVPLVAAAVCPHPPLIVPEIAVGAAAETADLRAACDAAVAALLSSAAESLVIVGADDTTREYQRPFRGSLARWGAPAADVPGEDRLPLSLLIGAWLLGRGPSYAGAARMVGVDPDEPPAACAELGERLGSDRPWALLAMGDGSACRGLKSPGYDDPRAEPYDRDVARALAGADVDALLALDPALSAQLKAAGRAPWQVLAGAARAAGGPWRGELTYDAAPYGVAYLVATWQRP
jgi:hypothetical protein